MARKAKNTKVKEPIKLRVKKLANGNGSLYLDQYKDGKRSYEFLELYLVPESSPSAQIQNANTLAAANAIKAQRIIALTTANTGVQTAASKASSKILLGEWIDFIANSNLTSQRRKGEKRSESYAKLLQGTKRHLAEYKGDGITLADVTQDFCKGFIEYLKNANQLPRGGKKAKNPKCKKDLAIKNKAKNTDTKPLSPKSIRSYFVCFKYAIQQAVDRGEIQENPLRREDVIPNVDSHRVYLSVEELNRMAETPCRNDGVKAAFMFGCFTGLRFSDINTLTWGNITEENGLTKLSKTQVKTKRQLDSYLAEEALQWLPECNGQAKEDLVFKLRNYYYCERIVKEWAKAAEIDKYVTFHTSRHTFATTLITLGEDIYTTSQLLGHSNVRTTQIYADIVSEKKAKAVSRLNGIIKSKKQ